MAIKTRIDSTKSWTWQYSAGGNPPYATGKAGPYQNYSECQAVFSRPRPPILDCTGLVVTRRTYNQGDFTDVAGIVIATGGCNAPWQTLNTRFVANKASASDLSTAKLKAAASFTSDRMDLGETIGGFKDTIKMLSSTVQKLSSFFRDIPNVGLAKAVRKHGLPTDGIDMSNGTKRISNAYLAGIFGWFPLVEDIGKGLELLWDDKPLDKSGDLVRKRRSVRREDLKTDSGAIPRATAGILGQVDKSGLRNLNSLGMANLPLAVWQAVPHSFLFDWLVNVSELLALFSWKLGLKNVVGWTILTEERTRSYERVGLGWTFWQNTSIAERLPWAPAGLVWQGLMPDIGLNLSVGKAVTAAALLRQRF